MINSTFMPGFDQHLDAMRSEEAIDPSEIHEPESETLPMIVGYKISARLGSGGMGSVYRAHQLSTNRDVALKVMRSDVTRSSELRSLFAQEVRLAARLVHPNVVRIYDSGIDCGLYYYAMELVEGTTLDQHVLGARGDPALPRRQILQLMRDVCQGVHHAHLRGVIHRDLKPRNIVVTPDGQPHVLDFGLATVVLKNRLDDLEQSSPPDRRIDHAEPSSNDYAGTPAFMSPEQTSGRSDELDIRTDVYSLGVTLYLLLTGLMPHDTRGGATTVMTRVASQPLIHPCQTDSNIDPELQAILLKALARDREHRYPSAGEMALDLGKYLDGKPVSAMGSSPLYIIRKWLTRHRRLASVAAGVLVLISGLVTYSYVSRRALQRSLTNGKDYDRTLGELIARLSPQVSGRQVGNRDLLNGSATDATRIFQDRPATLAGILDRIGVTLLDQGWSLDAQRWIDRAVDLQLQSVGENQLESVRMINDQAQARREVGRSDDSANLSRRALALAASLPGGDSESLRAQLELAYALDDQGNAEEAARSAQAALALCRERYRGQLNHPDVLRSLYTLAFVLRDQGKLTEARQRAWDALSGRIQSLGEAHPDTIRAMDVYATILALLPDADSATRSEARQWIDKAVALSGTTLGLDHTDRLSIENDRGTILCRQSEFKQSASCLRSALESSTRMLGTEDRLTLALKTNLANVLCAWADQPDAAAAEMQPRLREEARDLMTQVISARAARDPSLLVLIDGLATVETQLQDYKEARANFEKTLQAREKSLPADDPLLASSLHHLAIVLEYQQDWANAELLLQRRWKMLCRSNGPDSQTAQAALFELNQVRKIQHESPELAQ